MTKCPPLSSDISINSPRPGSNIYNCNFPQGSLKEKMVNLKTYKSNGPDNVHVNVLNYCPTTPFIQTILRPGSPTSKLERCPCVSHSQKRRQSRNKNYRPVSLTSHVAKLMERLVLDSIVNHITKNGIISCRQHGFHSHCSCVTQLIECYYDWISSLDNGFSTDVIYLDFAKAFD